MSTLDAQRLDDEPHVYDFPGKNLYIMSCVDDILARLHRLVLWGGVATATHQALERPASIVVEEAGWRSD